MTFKAPKLGPDNDFTAYLYIVSLVVILRNWVCDNWVYQFPTKVWQEKPRNINILGGTLSGTNQTRPWDKRATYPFDKLTPSLGKNGCCLLRCTVNLPLCPVCPWDGWCLSVGRLSREGRQKDACVFLVSWRHSPKNLVQKWVWGTQVKVA